MDTLRLVEVAEDGDLVLMTGDGRRFRLAVDEPVRAAVRRTRAPAPPPAFGVRDDRPGPREVQTRIRAGADAEEVAAQTGLDVDYVRLFEGPVLAERAHVSEVARASSVDRGDPALTLERAVVDALTAEGHSAEDIAWDSRRAEAGRWFVVARARSGSSTTVATWSFDTATRSLEAADAAAERLTGAERRRRLSAVRDTVFDVERPASERPRGGTVELLDALARQRGRRPAPAAARGGERAAPDDQPGPTTAAGPDGHGADEHEPVEDDAGQPAADAPEGAPEPDAADQEPAVAAEPGEAQQDEQDEPARQTGTDGPGEVHTARARLGVVRSSTDEPRTRRTSGDGDVPAPSIEPDLLSELDLDVAPARPAPPGAARPAAPAAREARAASGSGGSGGSGAAGGDKRSRRRRTAVPSWDEIVFGAKRDD